MAEILLIGLDTATLMLITYMSLRVTWLTRRLEDVENLVLKLVEALGKLSAVDEEDLKEESAQDELYHLRQNLAK